MNSAAYRNSFWIILFAYLLFVEFYFRLSPAGHGSATVLRAWPDKGNARPVIILIGLITTTAFVGLAAEHLRNVYVALTGKPDSYIFLGDKLREGMYAARENDPAKQPAFVSALVSRNQHPNVTFAPFYDRKLVFQDPEGNLTSAEMLNTGRLILFSFLQLALLSFSALCVIAVADQFIAGFPGASSIQDLARAITLPDAYLWVLAVVLLLFYAGGVALVTSSMRGVQRAAGKSLPLPQVVAEGNILSGNVSVAVGRLKKERAARKAYYDQVFARLDQAMISGERMQFRVGEELDISPHIEALGKAPVEDEE